MNITLDTKLEYLIQQQINSGKYSSINDVIAEALSLLEKSSQYDQSVEKTEQKIDVATAQLDRGEGIDGEIAINQIHQNSLQTNNKDDFWSALQDFRQRVDLESIDDDSFDNLRDKSAGRDVIL